MRTGNESEACTRRQAVDLVSAVTEWHALSSQDLSMLIRDAENGDIRWTKRNGSSFVINVESLARYLALHLITKLLSPKRDEQHLRYMLGGLRLLHTLCDLAPRHSRLEQVLHDDVNVSEQILDLIFYTIILLSGLRQVLASRSMVLLQSASLASCLYLLLACISSKWHELTHVLLAHPKVDVFTSVAFPALRASVYFLHVKLSDRHTGTHVLPNVDEVRQLCQHCEASLQFLLSLCQQKLFRERLVMNKDLCEEGGALLLVQDIMELPACDDSYIMAAVSRLKSKVLSMMLHLCETEVERGSFLDLAASTTGGLDLAKSVVFQVLEVLRIMFCGDRSGPFKGHPRGLLQLNAMRLTEIFSDDSNFRSYIVLNFTEVLTRVFLLPHEEFLSSWCSSAHEPCEEDVIMEYDSLAASGQALGLLSTLHVVQSAARNRRAPQTPYARQKTSLLVKIIANLTSFLPDICKEGEGLFVNKFLQSLQKELPRLSDGIACTGGAERTAAACRNLHSLLHHAESLREYLNEDDVQLLRLFIRQLEARITPQESNIHRVKEIQNRGQSSSPAPQRSSPEAIDRSGNWNVSVDQLHQLNFNAENRSNDVGREDQRTGVPETSAAQGVHENDRNPQNIETNASVDRMNNVEGIPEDQIVRNVQSEEKQQKKRKRNIMNDAQITMIENALRDEPDMQRKAATIQFWADKLSLHGSEVTTSQLKNWLNRKISKYNLTLPSTSSAFKADATKEHEDASLKHSEKTKSNLSDAPQASGSLQAVVTTNVEVDSKKKALAAIQARVAAANKAKQEAAMQHQLLLDAANKDKALAAKALAEKEAALQAAAMAQAEKEQALKALADLQARQADVQRRSVATESSQGSGFVIQLPGLDRLSSQLEDTFSKLLQRIEDSSTTTSNAVSAALASSQAPMDLTPVREDVRSLIAAQDKNIDALQATIDKNIDALQILTGEVQHLRSQAPAPSFTQADRELLTTQGVTLSGLSSSINGLTELLSRFLSAAVEPGSTLTEWERSPTSEQSGPSHLSHFQDDNVVEEEAEDDEEDDEEKEGACHIDTWGQSTNDDD